MTHHQQVVVRQWLRSEGFNVGTTKSGWVAVNRRGIVITAGAKRTKVELEHEGAMICERIDDGSPLLYLLVGVINFVLHQAGSDINHEVPRDIESQALAVRVVLYKGEG
jgi:hypothetical protein